MLIDVPIHLIYQKNFKILTNCHQRNVYNIFRSGVVAFSQFIRDSNSNSMRKNLQKSEINDFPRVRESSKTKGDIDINRPSKRPITWKNALSWKVAIFPLAEISIVGCFIKGCCSQEIFVFPSGVEIPVFLRLK